MIKKSKNDDLISFMFIPFQFQLTFLLYLCLAKYLWLNKKEWILYRSMKGVSFWPLDLGYGSHIFIFEFFDAFPRKFFWKFFVLFWFCCVKWIKRTMKTFHWLIFFMGHLFYFKKCKHQIASEIKNNKHKIFHFYFFVK